MISVEWDDHKLAAYPIKGTIIFREKPSKAEYFIWLEDSTTDIVWNDNSHLNLVKIK